MPTASGAPPHVGLVVATMDRTADLALSLPSWLGQDYPNYSLTIVDYSSADGIASVIEAHRCERMHLVTLPLPRYWSHAKAGNACLRYAPPSDLVFVLSTDVEFRDARQLSEIVNSFLHSTDVDPAWAQTWRVKDMRYQPLTAGTSPPPMRLTHRRVYCHTFGGIIMVERHALLALGGYNEFLEDWGYEDTDLIMRLELSGFGHIGIEGMKLRQTSEDLRLKNVQGKDKQATWDRNRLLSDRFISTVGLVPPLPWYPGREDWVEIEGRRYEGWRASQQRLPLKRSFRFPELHAFFQYRDSLSTG